MLETRNQLKIPFNMPYMTGKEKDNIFEVLKTKKLQGNNRYTKKCQSWFEDNIGCQKAIMTHSCTAALEMASILADIKPGDEIIMPSYTFVSTATAFVLRGGVPVFVDISPNTLNIDVTRIEDAITEKTKAIVPVHYAGVGCDMEAIMAIAQKYDLIVIEDAAQGICAEYKEQPLGSLGHMATFSFHETKNIVSGEGGVLCINDPALVDRAEHIADKGTNRSNFINGEVDKYTWVDVGSSYYPSEFVSAFLWSQLERSGEIVERRLMIWQKYHMELKEFASTYNYDLPKISSYCNHNAHIYYMILPHYKMRDDFMKYLSAKNIQTAFHYVPLHSAPASMFYGRAHGDMSITERVSRCLVRLPLWLGVEKYINYIIKEIKNFSREYVVDNNEEVLNSRLIENFIK